MKKIDWNNLMQVTPISYICGHCGNQIATKLGYYAGPNYCIYICPFCTKPTYFEHAVQMPGAVFGDEVDHLPDDIDGLYQEARRCITTSSFTTAVMAIRKLLMNIAVNKGAKPNRDFWEYVDYLDSKGYIPPDNRAWVEHIRLKGNEANHEIKLMSEADAKELISFLGMLLKFVFEFPSKITPSP